MKKLSFQINLPDISDYVNLLVKRGVTMKGKHWLCKSEKDLLAFRRAMAKLRSPEEYGRSPNSVLRLKKKDGCKHRFCVNPKCWYAEVLDSDRFSGHTLEDAMELLEEIDIKRIDEIGITSYVNEYNEDMPDFLKIDEKFLKNALRLKEGR